MIDSYTPPDEGIEYSLSSVDQLLDDLTAEERVILWQYMRSGPNDMSTHLTLRKLYGERFDKIAFQVQELIAHYGCSFDAMRGVLLIRLETDEPYNEDDEHDTSELTRDSQRNTVNWSVPQSSLSPAEFVDRLTPEQKQMLQAYLSLKNPDDGNAVMGLSRHYGEPFVELVTKVSALRGSLESVRESVSEALRASSEGPEPESRKTISFGPSMEAFENQATVPAPESSRPVESDPAPASHNIPRAVIVKTPPRANMSTQEFIRNLTAGGRCMLEVILAMEDMRDGVALSKLEKKYGTRGFVLLASYIIERRNVNLHDTGQLLKALKADGEKVEAVIDTQRKREPVVKRKSLPGSALFGKGQKRSE